MPIICPPPGGSCVDFELTAALNDIKCIVGEWGMPVTFRPRVEVSVVRDRYDGVKRFNNPTEVVAPVPVSLYAYPVNFNPTTRDVEKAGLRERTEVILWTPRLVWNEANITFNDIDMERATFLVQSNVYEIKDKAQVSQFRGDFLYFNFGLHKK